MSVTAMGARQEVSGVHSRAGAHGNRFHPNIEMGSPLDQPGFVEVMDFLFKAADETHASVPIQPIFSRDIILQPVSPSTGWSSA
jgi:hypothetical protein